MAHPQKSIVGLPKPAGLPSEEKLGSKNFTPHQSPLAEEGRRNQPKVHSPKKTKLKHSKEHIAAEKKHKEMGALEPFMTDDEDLLK